tara:strand:+ start:1677 stop:1967 length:291 start_codon:yes stop_codon:yes gene_type:complete
MNNKIIFLIFLFIFVIFVSSSNNIEGFNTYNSCIEQGYPMDFCVKTPIQSKIDSGFCSCADGYFGSWHMGDGKCYCFLDNGLIQHNKNHEFQSSPF